MPAAAERTTPPAPPSLATALSRVQGSLPHVRKDKQANVGQYRYSYADLASISAAVLPVLSEHGLAFTALPTVRDEQFVLAYALLHGASSERLEGSYPLPDPTRTDAQKVGSAITYARRYALCAVLGIVPDDEDDDGAAAPRADRKVQRPMPQHVQDALSALGALAADDQQKVREWAQGTGYGPPATWTEEQSAALVERCATQAAK